MYPFIRYLHEGWSRRLSPQSRNLEAFLVIICGILFAVAFSLPVLSKLQSVSTSSDWDQHSELYWVPFHTVTHFHQFPLWNPYECGGIPMLANPQSRVLSPFFLLTLLLGPGVMLHLEIPLHLAAGWVGCYVLTRVQGLRPAAGVVCGSIFAGSSWFSLHIAVGHIPYLSFLYLPWIATAIWLGIARHRLLPAAIAGGLVALTLGEGGIYGIPQAFLLALSLCLIPSILQRSLWPIFFFAIFAFFAFGFAAIKLIPTLQLMKLHPRPWDNLVDATSLHALFETFFSRNQDRDRALVGTAWPFWEHGAYIGPVAAILAAVGIVAYTRRTIPWLVALLFFLALIMGNGGPYYPWVLLHKLPVFSSERVPSRFAIAFTLCLGVCAGAGTDFIGRWFKRWGSIGLYFIIACMIADLWVVSVPNLRYSFAIDRPSMPLPPSGSLSPGSGGLLGKEPEFHQINNPAFYSMLLPAIANEGSINCYEYTFIETSVRGLNQPGYRGEQYLFNPDGDLKLIRWTPNELRFTVDTPTHNVLVVNQNFNTGWRLWKGKGLIVNADGLLAVALPPKKQTIELVYLPASFILGSAITAFTCLLMIWIWRRERGIIYGPAISPISR